MNKTLKYTLELLGIAAFLILLFFFFMYLSCLPHKQQCFDRPNSYFNGELK